MRIGTIFVGIIFYWQVSSVIAEELDLSDPHVRRALRAFDEPPPHPIDLPDSNYDLITIMSLPRHIRASTPAYMRESRIEKLGLQMSLRRRSVPSLSKEGDVVELEASWPEVDFAPLATGAAVLTFRGEVKRVEGKLPIDFVLLASQYTERIEPISASIGSCWPNGITDNEKKKYLGFAKLESETAFVIVSFVKRNHEPISTNWSKVNGESAGLATLLVDREELVRQQPLKATDERSRREDARVRSAAREQDRLRREKIAKMDIRLWQDKNGLEWHAELQSYSDGKAKLLTDQLEYVTIDLRQMNEKSQTMLREMLKSQREKQRSRR